MKVIYEWTKRFLRRIEIFSQEDTAKKPEIPDASDTVRRLREATDQAHAKRQGILNRWRYKRHGKGH